MSAVVVDTSRWIAYFAGRSDGALEQALEEGRVWLPPIVAAELLSGRMTDAERGELESLLLDLPLCRGDHAHWFAVGRLRRTLAAAGVAVSTPDAHVAQCALDLDAPLWSEDRVFLRIAERLPLQLG